MSFVRVRKPHSAAGLPRKPKPRRKPAWDDTIQDLTALKATPEEIAQRKASHKSKNALGTRLERHKRGKSRDLSISNAEARQLAVMKEVLYDQKQLQDVLSKSDKMMSVVKDLFGDDPKRFTGFPNVTTAPDGEEHGRSRKIVAKLPDVQTRMDTLSESVMNQSALNDLPESDSDEGEEAEPIMYQPKMNMNRFQQFLEAEEKNNTISTISGQAHLSHLDHGPVQSTRIQETQSLQTTQECHTPPKKNDESIEILRSPKSAMNDTQKIKKTKRRVEPTENTSANSTFNLNELRKVLVQLENEIGDLETQTGRRPRAEQPRQESFSGYTVSLVDSVTKLSRYLKENELRLKAETLLREQLTQDMSQLTSLIDALTSDIIHTQEEYSKLQSDFNNYKMETTKEIHLLKTALQDAGILATTQHPSYLPKMDTTPPKMNSIRNHQGMGDPMHSIPPHVNSAAVLLSPPVRKTRVQDSAAPTLQEGPLPMMNFDQPVVDVTSYQKDQLNGQLSDPPHSQVNGYHGEHSTALQHPVRHPGPAHTQHPIGHQGPSHPHHPVERLATSHPQHPVRHPGLSHQQLSNHNTELLEYFQTQQQSVSQTGPSQRPVTGRPLQSNVQLQQDPRGSTGTYSVDVTSLPQEPSQPQLAARISVPRPSPLVQTATATQQQVSAQQDLTAQIAQLNQQHEEAQKRLKSLLQQQQEQQMQHEMGPLQQLACNKKEPPQQISEHRQQQSVSPQPKQLMAKTQQQEGITQESRPQQSTSQQRGLPSYPVSPPLSPISQRSDNFMSIQGMQQNTKFNPVSSHGITVSIPTVDLSLDSSPSPQ